MDNKCVAKNNCRHIYIIYVIIHTVYPSLFNLDYPKPCITNSKSRVIILNILMICIHIVIKLTFHISEFFSYLNKNIFFLHNEVNNITV